uniref:Uncharacterized protein n=1 Tax=Rhizophora mucronata TaxID=61149 RepID=A0A2P2K6I2_RHIMU
MIPVILPRAPTNNLSKLIVTFLKHSNFRLRFLHNLGNRPRLVYEKETSLHKPAGGLDLHDHRSDPIAQPSRLLQQCTEILELVFQRMSGAEQVRVTARH